MIFKLWLYGLAVKKVKISKKVSNYTPKFKVNDNFMAIFWSNFGN